MLTPDLIGVVFGVRAHVGTHPLTGRMHITVATRTAHEDARRGPTVTDR